MKLDDYAIQQLVPYMTGHNESGANFTGRELVDIFNKYGRFRDTYNNGLPIIKEGQNTSKKTYTENRLAKMNENVALSDLIEEVISKATLQEKCAEEIHNIISECGYGVETVDGHFRVTGLHVRKNPIIRNTPVFYKIQNDIVQTLDKAKISIVVAVAWFTNETLYKKLLEKKNQGVDIRVVVNNDGINKKYGIDLSGLNSVKVRSDRGGIMHEKFCVIDNQIVISGSYNWTDNAELRNAEHINITENDNELATKYSLEFNRLFSLGDKDEY